MLRIPGLIVLVLVMWTWADAARAKASGPAHHDAQVTLDPQTGAIALTNTITVDGEGRIALRLDGLYVIERLTLNGVVRSPDRQGDILIVDVGLHGHHTITIQARASLATKVAHERPPFLGPEGGFLGRGWLGNPRGQPATYTIKVETPLPQVAVMPGALHEEHRANGRYSAMFSSTVPGEAPILITGPFSVDEKSIAGVRLRTYFHEELAPLATGYLDDAARYVEHYAAKIGPYPYPGFAMVSGPLPVGLGLPGMTYMGRRVLALPFIRTTSLPHEVLHNWWGNAVAVDYATGNWAEGLTTYQADHAQSASQNQDGGADKRLEWLRNFAALPSEADRPVVEFVAKSHDATQVMGYGKVAHVFHMLKMRLGADTFDRAIQRFYADNRGRHAGWSDIQSAFEAASGEDLSTFFEAWLTRPGAPQLALYDVAVTGDMLTFTLKQVQDGAPFPITVPVEVETEAGPVRVMAPMAEKSKTFRIQVEGPPTVLKADPAFDVFRRLDAREIPPILRDVTLNAATRLMIVGTDPAVKSAAHALGTRLLERDVQPLAATDIPENDTPLIVAGLDAEVRTYLQRQGLPQPPRPVSGNADGRAYIARDDQNRAVLAVLARDVNALNTLARVLPHYKRRSFIVLNDGRVTAKGTFAPNEGPLVIRLDGSH